MKSRTRGPMLLARGLRWGWPMVLSASLLAGCRAEQRPAAEGASARADGSVALGHGVRFLGRVSVGAGSARYSWSGAGFVVRFSGTGLSAELTDPGNLHSVLVDGERVRSLRAGPGRARHLLVRGLPPGEHEVALVRRTEALFGPTELHALVVHEGVALPPPPPASRSLEVIGDSISSGYGNLGDVPTCPFSPDTQDHYLSYGSLLAQRLGAELSTVAWSGRGVVKNYAGQAGELMPALYERTLAEDAGSRWPFERSADAVVINLGTNDFSTEPDPTVEEFSAEYLRLLELVRAKNAEAFIVATVGPMLLDADRRRAEEAIQAAVDARARQGDTRVIFHSLAARNERPGCDYHPGLDTHRAMAEELFLVLQKL